MITKQRNDSAKTPVSEQAVLKRVNRLLAHDQEAIRTYRYWKQQLTPYYYVDLYRDVILAEHIDLEAFARNLGVLSDDETVVYE